MLACKISFINQISQLAEALGANIDAVQQVMGLDPRIGPLFLNAGIGYGGSCFPKDVRALVQLAQSNAVEAPMLTAIESVNMEQKEWVLTTLKRHFNKPLRGLTLGVWGVAFKPNTNDIREASSIHAINSLVAAGVTVVAYDPAARPNIPHIIWCQHAEEVLQHKLDGLIIATEWAEFTTVALDHLRDIPLFDGRNCFSLEAVHRAQLQYYYSVGRPTVSYAARCFD
jgi:UDPglucose 6-dehydrogenase